MAFGSVGAAGANPFGDLLSPLVQDTTRGGDAGAAAGSGDSGHVGTASGASFASVLAGKLKSLDASQADSAQASQDMATGQVDDIAQTMLRIQQAEISLQVATQTRNKVLEAYNDIIHMQV